MIEKKKITDEDLAIIHALDEQLENFAKMHHRIRKEFLRTEAVILREEGVSERELKTFVVGVGKSLGIEESDLQNWRIDLQTGEFCKDAPDPEPELPTESESTLPEAEPPLSKEEELLQSIRNKYKRQ